MVHSNLSWFSLTCHGAGPVQLVMVQSNLSWYSLTCHGAVQLVMVQFNFSWCSPTCHSEIQLVRVQSNLSWCSLTCHSALRLVMVRVYLYAFLYATSTGSGRWDAKTYLAPKWVSHWRFSGFSLGNEGVVRFREFIVNFLWSFWKFRKKFLEFFC